MQEMTGCSRASSASRETKTTAVHNQMHYQRWFIRPPCITCLDYHHCALKRSKAISQFFSPSALRDFFGSSSFSMYDAEGDAPLGLWHTRNFVFNLDLFLCNWKSCKFPSVTRCVLCVQKEEKDSKNCIIPLETSLQITEKVSVNIASEASYVYILSGQKLIKNAKNGAF